MKVGVLADVHGNSHALRAVLEQATRLNVDHLLVLGDLVGYYHDARGVLELLEPWPRTVIKGNHEDLLETARFDGSRLVELEQKYGSAHRTAIETLSSTQLDYLNRLPRSLDVSLGGAEFRLCHGSPQDPDEYIYPDSSAEVLRRCCDETKDFVLLGHTHHAFFFSGGSRCTVLNPGSVGQPRDGGDGAAAWALVDTVVRTIRCLRTSYDKTPLIEEISKLDPSHPNLQNVLKRK